MGFQHVCVCWNIFNNVSAQLSKRHNKGLVAFGHFNVEMLMCYIFKNSVLVDKGIFKTNVKRNLKTIFPVISSNLIQLGPGVRRVNSEADINQIM